MLSDNVYREKDAQRTELRLAPYSSRPSGNPWPVRHAAISCPVPVWQYPITLSARSAVSRLSAIAAVLVSPR